ncbi:MAG: sugar phosphate isomerase/epimerase family protein [Thermoguttaceae bacterium]
MQSKINRRSFLAVGGMMSLGMGLMGGAPRRLLADEIGGGAPNAEKLGWRLGCQAYSFNRFTFFDAVDKVASLGLKYIEAYPSQLISKKHGKLRINEALPARVRGDLKKKLGDCGVKLVNYGVCGLSAKEDVSRRTFDFAKQMGIETLVSEPNEDALPMLDELCNEYGINIAIHNHPQPSHYWNPDTVLKACKGRSKRIGACADVGHWVRSGLKPVDALKELEGRIVSFHLKDRNKPGMGGDAHDVPLGQGVCDMRGALCEIHRQGVKAVFSIEYEYHWDNSLPEIAQCAAYFDKISAELIGKKVS